MTDTWDPSIPDHMTLAHEIELGNGIPEMRHLSKAREAFKTVGFSIEHEEDLAERPDPIPWYYPLEGDIFKAQTTWDYFTVWRMSCSGKFVTHNVLRLLELFRIVPKGTYEVGEALRVAGDALVKGGQTKVSRWPGSLNTFLSRLLRSSLRRCTWSSRGSLRAEGVTRLRTVLIPPFMTLRFSL
jgi:sterol 24-C-methyltransferase